jgi:hypothetical protein
MARWPSGPLALETAPAGRRGAAIGRPRTPGSGGGRNPLASVRVPCARMVGRGIASSLVNEGEH